MYIESRVLVHSRVEVFSYSVKANPAPQAIILVGLPGSGKSTFRHRKLLPSLKFRGRNFAVYSTDDYLEEIAIEESQTYAWALDKRFNVAKKYAQEALDIGLSYGCDLIFDQTNLSEAKRKSIIDKLPHNYSRSCVYLSRLFLVNMSKCSRAGRINRSLRR